LSVLSLRGGIRLRRLRLGEESVGSGRNVLLRLLRLNLTRTNELLSLLRGGSGNVLRRGLSLRREVGGLGGDLVRDGGSLVDNLLRGLLSRGGEAGETSNGSSSGRDDGTTDGSGCLDEKKREREKSSVIEKQSSTKGEHKTNR
jgi:hypothetical protein